VVVAMLGTSVDFVGDTLDQARAEFDKHMTGPLPPGADAMMDVAMEQAETELGKVIQTEATPWLWGTMALWGGLAVCGVMIASGPGVAGASTSTSACRMTHTPYRREDAPASGGAPRRGNARGVPASRPNHAPAPRAPVGSALPDFGPSLAPLASASVPASPAEPTEDEHGTSHEDDDPPEPPSPGRALCEPY